MNFRSLLALDDVLVDRRADDLPAGVRLRLRLAGLARSTAWTTCSSSGPGRSPRRCCSRRCSRRCSARSSSTSSSAPTTRSSRRRSTPRSSSPAEALWIAARAGVYGCVPMLVAMVFGLDPSWGMLLVPFIAFLSGFGWACFGIFIAAVMKSIDNFSYVTSTVITPLFLVAGHVLPDLGPAASGRRSLAQPQPALPLRAARARRGVRPGLVDLWHLAFLVAFGAGDVAAGDQSDGAQADRLSRGRRRPRRPCGASRAATGSMRRCASSCGRRCCSC